MVNKILLDVRTAGEYAEGHKEGAINLPIENIISGDLGVLKDMSKDVEIECYCHSGGRSGLAKMILNNYGYKNVRNIGGI